MRRPAIGAAASLRPLDPLRYRSALALGLLRLATEPRPLRWDRFPRFALEGDGPPPLLDAERDG